MAAVGIINASAALLLLLVAAAHLAQRFRLRAWHYGAYALAFTGLASVLLLVVHRTFRPEPILAGVVVLEGLVWSSLLQPARRLPLAQHSLLAGLGALTAVALSAISLAYQWWFPPLALLLAMAAGALAPGIVWLRRRFWPAPPAPAPPAPPAPAQPAPPAAQPPQAPSATAKVAILCPSCGLRGTVAAQGPPTLKCPRCAATVTRPQPSASPPPGAAPAPRTQPPPRRGPPS